MTDRDKEIVEKYKAGKSAVELSEEYPLAPRSIQRIVKLAGAIRTQSESYRLAI